MIQVSLINGMGSATDSLSGAVTTAGANDSDFMHIASDFLQNQGVLSIDTGDFEVGEHSPANKSVDILEGIAYVKNTAWVRNEFITQYYRVESSATENVTISDNVSGNPRIDLIVIKIDSSVTPNDNASNVATIEVITGTPAASPVAPSIPSDGNHYYTLAEVAVANGFTSIVDANISDDRAVVELFSEKMTNPNIIFNDSAPNYNVLVMAHRETTQQALTAGVADTVLFNVEDFDIGGDYDPVTGEFTAPVTGYYLVSAQLMFAVTADGDALAGWIYLDSTAKVFTYLTAYGTASQVLVVSPTLIYATAGQIITIEARNNSNNDNLIASSAAGTGLNIRLVSI